MKEMRSLGCRIPDGHFGHFIEHWGRCINFDGICAENLVNNHFANVPGSDAWSAGTAFPWEPTRYSWGTRLSLDSLVYHSGTSSQLVDKGTGHAKPFGIRQRVFVEEGHRYDVRIILKHNLPGLVARVGLFNKDETICYGSGELALESPLWTEYRCVVGSTASDDDARFCITISQAARLWIDYASLVDEQDSLGYRTDLVKAIRKIRPSLMRWPGGWFADHYHWADGIGPVEHRPTRVRRELAPIEPNNFGTDEYIGFCREVGAEPYINLNFGSGSLEEMRAWVEYCNGSPETNQGAVRAFKHPEPYHVKYWCIGNEMYLKFAKRFYIEPEEYGREVVRIAGCLREVDPEIYIVATGDATVESDWNRRLLSVCGRDIDVFTIHRFAGGNWEQTEVTSLEIVDTAIRDMEASIDACLALMDQYCAPETRLGVDEWNVWLASDNFLEHDYGIREGVYAARMLQLLFRHADRIAFSAPAQLVNVMGVISTKAGKPVINPIYRVFELFRDFAGQEVVIFESPSPFVDALGYRDSRGLLSWSFINYSESTACELDVAELPGISLEGLVVDGPGEPRRFRIGKSMSAFSLAPWSILVVKPLPAAVGSS